MCWAFNEINDEMFIVTVTCKNSNCQLNSYLFIKILSYAFSPMRDVARDFVILRFLSRMCCGILLCFVSDQLLLKTKYLL